MKEFDFNSVKTKILFALIALLTIFCFARLLRPVIYDEATVTHVYNVNGENIIIYGYRSQSTEEWEKNINVHNKQDLDETENIGKNNEESMSDE